MLFKNRCISSKLPSTRSFFHIALLSVVILQMASCIVPEEGEQPPQPKVERTYLVPIVADSDIIAVDAYHPTHQTVLENTANLQSYRLARYVDYNDGNTQKVYYPYLAYVYGNNIYFRDLWPTHYRDPLYITSLPTNDITGFSYPLCGFELEDGYRTANDQSNGYIHYQYPSGGGTCDNFDVFDDTKAAFNPLAPYPRNNKYFKVALATGASEIDEWVVPKQFFGNYFALLINFNRPLETSPLLQGRMIGDNPPNTITWYPNDNTDTGSAITMKSNVADYSYIARSVNDRQLIFFLVDRDVYVFDVGNNQDPTTALDISNSIHTLSAAATPDLANFFYFSNNRVFFIDNLNIHFIRLTKDTNQALYPVELLVDLSQSGAQSLEILKDSQLSTNYIFVKELLGASTDYNLVAIGQASDNIGQRHLVAQLDAGAETKMIYDHYYVNDPVKSIKAFFDANVDYTDTANQPMSLPPNTEFAGWVSNDFTPAAPGPTHAILSEALGGDSYKLYYFAVDSGESLYLGDISYPANAVMPHPTFVTKLIADGLLLVRTVIDVDNNVENGVAVSRIDREGTLTPLLTEYSSVVSMR